MPRYSVPGCTQQRGHQFASNRKMRRKWIIATKRDDACGHGRLWRLGPAARVCSQHFDVNDYTTSVHANKIDMLLS